MSGPFRETDQPDDQYLKVDRHPCNIDNTIEKVRKVLCPFGVTGKTDGINLPSRKIHDESSALRVHEAHSDEGAEKQAGAYA